MDEYKIKYLEFLQNNISRMSNNSFLFKGWALTLVSAIVTCSITIGKFYIGLIAFLPAFIFWALDAYYLQLERKYRALYNAAILDSSNKNNFNMSVPSSQKQEKTLYIQSLFSKTMLLFYCALEFAIAIVILVVKFAIGR